MFEILDEANLISRYTLHLIKIGHNIVFKQPARHAQWKLNTDTADFKSYLVTTRYACIHLAFQIWIFFSLCFLIMHTSGSFLLYCLKFG